MVDIEAKRIPDDVVTMVEAFSTNSRAANRLWLFAASVTIYVIGAKSELNFVTIDGEAVQVGGDVVTFLAIKMDAAKMYLVAAYLLALVNLAYCSAHLQSYHVSKIFSELLTRLGAERIQFAGQFDLGNTAYTMMLPNLNRVYPLVHSVPAKLKTIVYFCFKIVIDVVMIFLPWLGLLVSFLITIKDTPMIESIPQLQPVLQPALWVLFIMSSFASLMLLFVSFEWIFRRTRDDSRRLKA